MANPLDLRTELLDQLVELRRIRKQSVRKGRPDLATAATAQMVQIVKAILSYSEAAQDANKKQQSQKPPEYVWRIVMDDPSCRPLTPEQQDVYICDLLRERASREGTSEVLLAAMARVISELEGEPLPPELEKQVHHLLDLILVGNEPESGTAREQ